MAVKILFVMQHPGYARNYESTIQLLAERGHDIHLAFCQHGKRTDGHQGDVRLVTNLASKLPNVAFGDAPAREDTWTELAWAVRSSRDFLRFIHPRFRHTVKLRRRAANHAPAPVVAFAGLPLFQSHFLVNALKWCLEQLERAIPSDPRIEAFIASHLPELVLVTPLINFGSKETEYIKSARALGIRTGLCVASWDNLTNKGQIQIVPEMILVWNEIQKQEVVELHAVHPERVVVTGAQRFDEWFGRRPRRSREEFCRLIGLSSAAPFLLYVCSSTFITPDEAPFVQGWIRAVRNSRDPRIRKAGILVRPHPQNAEQWRNLDLSAFEHVAVWPRTGANPVDDESKSDYFDSLYHSAAVVGINTSALIEAGIVGRPVHTLLAPEFVESQHGTLHFHYLADAHRGLLQVAHTMDEHIAQLSVSLRSDPATGAKLRQFVESFVRPNGYDVACTPLVVEAIERLGAMGRFTPGPENAWYHALRWLVLPAAWAGHQGRRWRSKWLHRHPSLSTSA